MFIFFNKFPLKFHGTVASKLENLVFYHNKTVILCPESFVEKFLFWQGNVQQRSMTMHDVFVEVQENIQQRSVTYVWKCKRTPSSVA